MSLDDLVRKTKNDKSRISGPSKPQFKAAKPIHEKGLQHFNAHKKRGFTAKSRPSFVRNAAAPPPPITSNKLLVSNLAITVSQDDVTELFSEFGDLTSASLHHDQVGRPLGTAEIVFKTPQAAQAAINKYHGIPLDNQVMNIQFAVTDHGLAAALTPPPMSVRLGLRNISGPGTFKGQNGHQTWKARIGTVHKNHFKKNGKRGPNKKLGSEKELPSATELDAEMDAYMAEMPPRF